MGIFHDYALLQDDCFIADDISFMINYLALDRLYNCSASKATLKDIGKGLMIHQRMMWVGIFLSWQPPSSMRADPLIFFGHHGCVNNAIF